MRGPTLTFSPGLFDNKASVPRSLSSPSLPDLATLDNRRQSSARPASELPRSASFTSLPAILDQYTSEKEIQSSTSAAPTAKEANPLQPTGDEWKQDAEDRPKSQRIGRRKSLVARPKSWIQKVKSSPERQNPPRNVPITTTSNAAPPTSTLAGLDKKMKSVSGSFAAFTRRSWISSSRSPSPHRCPPKVKGEEKDTDHDEKFVTEKATGLSTTTGNPSICNSRSVNPLPTSSTKARLAPDAALSPHKISRAGSTLQKIRQRPASVFMNLTALNSTNSSTSSLPRSSLDNRSTPRTSTDKVPPLPALSSEKIVSLGIETPRKRDELWSAFRSLENDFAKFQAKSWSLKTNVVRASLLPFLRNHAAHPSNQNLRPEDLDRRITILNKWWTGLLEVLDGRQNQTVSGVDRPILLDACYAIMTRPEWRLAPSLLASPSREKSANRSPDRKSTMQKKSTTSLKTPTSQFMIESVYHNTRNLFVQNLLSQMNFVVDKMSFRHAPASLVTFCGKAAAYAFFFVPGIAGILVRIWRLHPNVLRRVSDEFGKPRRPDQIAQDEVVAPFPSHLHPLGWSSVKSMATLLRQAPVCPMMASKISWYGPWVARWCGRDSDLFFVFAKHYHILAEEYISPDLSLVEKARAPGFILVHAQILTALDATIHRQPAADPLPITFDDVLAGADASAAALPLPSTNSARLMAENRLVMLLRDFLCERPSNYQMARLTFGEAFAKMVKAAARKTSLFDHNACFVVCDFMEEAMSIFVRFHRADELKHDFIDWYFWLDVCKKMLESENTMSDIRLFAFLFGAWNLITAEERRKEVMCLDWLLAEDTFEKFFNHWCPMVRAYYMRLLCWRLCRDDGESSELDTKIFHVVSIRIRANWAHYLFLKQQAEKTNSIPPSVTPCQPAPGRRLLIIRNDSQSPVASLFLGFDGIVPQTTPAGTSQPTAYKRHSSLAVLVKAEPAKAADQAKVQVDLDRQPIPTPPTRKRWTLGKMLTSPFSSTNPIPVSEATSCPSTTRAITKSPTGSSVLDGVRKETVLTRSRERPSMRGRTGSTSSVDSDGDVRIDACENLVNGPNLNHRTFSFKFSLEWTTHFEKANGGGNGPRVAGASERGDRDRSTEIERRLNPPRLPAPAQAWLGSHGQGGVGREVLPCDPATPSSVASHGSLSRAKYTGRALAEWGFVVSECNGFMERRRSEGVPGLKWIEVPTLGVESFRKFN